MAEIAGVLVWTLISECPIPDDVKDLLVGGEEAICAYKTFRDSAIFTNKRLIVRDAQGITGKKVEIYGAPNLTADSLKNAASKFIPIEEDLLL